MTLTKQYIFEFSQDKLSSDIVFFKIYDNHFSPVNFDNIRYRNRKT